MILHREEELKKKEEGAERCSNGSQIVKPTRCAFDDDDEADSSSSRIIATPRRSCKISQGLFRLLFSDIVALLALPRSIGSRGAPPINYPFAVAVSYVRMRPKRCFFVFWDSRKRAYGRCCRRRDAYTLLLSFFFESSLQEK